MTIWLIVELWLGFRDQKEAHLWVAFSTLAAMAIFGMRQDWISVRTGTAPLLMVTFAFACLLAMGRIHHHTRLGFAAPMLRRLGLTLPAIVFLLIEANTIFGWTSRSFALHGFALLSISALYFYQGLLHHQSPSWSQPGSSECGFDAMVLGPAMARPPALSRSTRTFPNRLGGDPSAGIADLDPQSSSFVGALIVLSLLPSRFFQAVGFICFRCSPFAW